jgi:hypothetical protein
MWLVPGVIALYYTIRYGVNAKMDLEKFAETSHPKPYSD